MGDMMSHLWRVRWPNLLGILRRRFNVMSDLGRQFPLLRAFVAGESGLSSIRCIVDIFDWHRILFELNGRKRLTLDDASSLTLNDVIEKVPLPSQKRASDVLDKFIDVFNRVLPMISHLYECEQNPFICCPMGCSPSESERGGDHPAYHTIEEGKCSKCGADGAVDIEGKKFSNARTPAPLTRHSPLMYSLPYSPPSGGDPRGFCTVAMLELIARTQNSLVDNLSVLVVDQLERRNAPLGSSSPALQMMADKGVQEGGKRSRSPPPAGHSRSPALDARGRSQSPPPTVQNV